MSATASSASRARALAVVCGLALACSTNEVEIRPFRIEVTLADGSPLVVSPELDPLLLLAIVSGPYHRVSANEATISDANRGVVTMRFDPTVAPDVGFPEDVEGLNVTALVGIDETATAPDDTPNRVTGIRLQTGGVTGGDQHFLIGEGSQRADNGVAAIPVPLTPLLNLDLQGVAFPSLTVWADNIYYEPSDCGIVYYDRLRVLADDGIKDAARDETVTVRIGDPAAPRWKVRNVLSWHRVGDCSTEKRVWTQIVMWRDLG